MSNSPFLIRADASNAIGAGHVMRCLALAQAWQDSGGRAIFAFAELPSLLEQRLRSEGFDVARISCAAGSPADAEATIALVNQRRIQWAIVDGDRFDVDFLHRVRSEGLRLLLFDDFARRSAFPANLILNPNMGASEAPYRDRGATARLCLGESYVSLRREFFSRPASRVFAERGCRVLVTMGGSDPEGLSVRIVETLRSMPHCEITAVAGPAHAHPADLQRLSSQNVRVLSNPPDMREVMEQTDIAIIAAGGTLWELLYMGCAILSYARNPVQAEVIARLAEKGAVRHMGTTQDLDPDALVDAVEDLAKSRSARERLARIGRQTIDGQGSLRVLRALREEGGLG